MISYTVGSFDVLRAENLQDLDMQIQLSKENGAKFFGVGVYDDNLCENLGMGKPLKSLNDRMEIVKYLRGVDFVFSISSLDEELIKNKIMQIDFSKLQEIQNIDSDKKYNIGYAPGTYDLFHAGHLENLLIASQNSKKLIVGVKSDELVKKHKNKLPNLTDIERAEILRHFKFVYDTYIYIARNPNIANDWIKSKYGQCADAIFLGSDLKNDFNDYDNLNIVYTERPPELMKERSTTAYTKRYRSLKMGDIGGGRRFTGNIEFDNQSLNTTNKDDIIQE